MRRGGRADCGRGVAASMLVARSTRRRVDSVGWKQKGSGRDALDEGREEEDRGEEKKGGRGGPQQDGGEEDAGGQGQRAQDERAALRHKLNPGASPRVPRCLCHFGPCGLVFPGRISLSPDSSDSSHPSSAPRLYQYSRRPQLHSQSATSSERTLPYAHEHHSPHGQ